MVFLPVLAIRAPFMIDLVLQPGWGWLLSGSPWIMIGLVVGVGFGLFVSLRAIHRVLGSVPAPVTLLLVAIGLLSVGASVLFGGAALATAWMKAPRVHHLDAPDGQRAVLILWAGSTDGALFLGRPPLDHDDLFAHQSLEVYRPLTVRRSPRGRRYVVVGVERVVGALIDLDVPYLLRPPYRPEDWSDFPPIEAVRAEFGEDLWLEYPGCGGRPEEGVPDGSPP